MLVQRTGNKDMPVLHTLNPICILIQSVLQNKDDFKSKGLIFYYIAG